jgi:D-alanyl-lipoteichoic acid acyltransferase DltB (MBOAT superfamily)
MLLLSTITIDYLLGLWIYHSVTAWKRSILLTLSIICNLGVLGYFKYTNFFHEIFSNLASLPYKPFDIFLPVGVSFFTFQSLSYTIDIYRKQIKPAEHILDYAFFVSFFPQLVAGPIVRAADFLPQLSKPTFVTKEMFGKGVFLISIGLFKKAVISDYISANFVDRIFETPTLFTGIENLFGLYGYALQIYCDFSGYSDMAIGIALLLGFHFNENFNAPYKAKNITDFWRRWHISLSTWLKDYLYISLGGNRHGRVRTYFNLIITMLLGGLWHGASFRFIIWGGLHGVALAVNKFFKEFIKPISMPAWTTSFSSFLGILVTFHFVCFCWIFFRAPGLEQAFQMIDQILFQFKANVFFELLNGYWRVFILIAVGYLFHFVPANWFSQAEKKTIQLPLVGKMALLLVVIVLCIQARSAAIQPFIYFQF